ncbi:hypothetical protein ACFL6O_02455, partial [candidate division KSB1 bacterium]
INMAIAVLLFTALFVETFPGNLCAQQTKIFTHKEFTQIMNSLSEEGGYYRDDIWITNEQTYLDVIPALKDRNVKGGVYLGVAPSQNYTYIAAVKPELAFIIDIRKQNRMQHLVYKILFEISETRAEFFSYLFSKPINPAWVPEISAGIDEIVAFFGNSASDSNMLVRSRDMTVEMLESKYGIDLDSNDIQQITAVFRVFHEYNLGITSNGGQRNQGRGGYNRRGGRRRPTYAEILTLVDPDGNQSNAFSSRENYIFLRNMHLENRIIPITGDFAGTKAIAAVAEFINQRKLTVSAFYTSNVEYYLFQNMVFDRWAKNVKLLPIDENSVFIRNFSRNYRVTWLQLMKTFVSDFDNGVYRSYYDLAESDHIR